MAISFETLALAKRYTRSAVTEAMGGVSKIDFRFVTSLPLVGEAGVIYCVSKSGSEPDLYDEYYYANGRFERIPGATIDLTPYATKEWVNGEGYYKKPADGIPKTDLDDDTKAAIEKANTALQEHQSLTAYRTAAVQDVIDAAQDTAIAGKYTKPGTGIPENDLASDVQSKIDNALPKTGDGSNVTAAFSAAANRTNISTGEKLSVIFGKIAKWFSDLGSAAFRAATGSITQGSTDLVESGAVYNGLSGKYSKPAGGIPASDMAQAVQTSLGLADTALQEHQSLAAYRTAAAQDVIDAAQDDEIALKQAAITASGVLKGDGAGGVSAATPGTDYATPSLGITGTSAGQFMKVKTVDANGKPTAWETEPIKYTLTVTVLTQDGVTVTDQTVTMREGGANGQIFATAVYNGQPVSFAVPVGFVYYVSVSDNLASHFNPTTATGIITDTNVSVTLTYSDFSNIRTAADIQAALNADIDLTELVGEQISCQKGNNTLAWDVADYNDESGEVTLLLHDTLPAQLQFEPVQALAYFEHGLPAGDYKFKSGNTYYYFTLTKAIPEGGQLKATTSTFQTYESQSATATLETGTVSTTEISGATDLGTAGAGELNHMDRVNYGSNNYGESGLRQWLNSSAPASTPMPRINKFSRPYVVAEPGFLSDLDPDFVACLADTEWRCSANNVYEAPASIGGIAVKSNPYTVTDKIGLASEMEIFGSYGGVQDGSKIFDLYVGATADDRKKYYNNGACYWWLRSPIWSVAYFERYVDTYGTASYYYAFYSSGVVPACKIKKSV